MSDDRQVTAAIIAHLGAQPDNLEALLTNPTRARAVAADLAPGDRSLRNALAAVAELGVFRNVSLGPLSEPAAASIVARLETEHGIHQGAARRAVSILDAAMRGQQPELASSPTDPVPPIDLPGTERGHDASSARQLPRRRTVLASCAVVLLIVAGTLTWALRRGDDLQHLKAMLPAGSTCIADNDHLYSGMADHRLHCEIPGTDGYIELRDVTEPAAAHAYLLLNADGSCDKDGSGLVPGGGTVGTLSCYRQVSAHWATLSWYDAQLKVYADLANRDVASGESGWQSFLEEQAKVVAFMRTHAVHTA